MIQVSWAHPDPDFMPPLPALRRPQNERFDLVLEQIRRALKDEKNHALSP
jgi:hypothetical protein